MIPSQIKLPTRFFSGLLTPAFVFCFSIGVLGCLAVFNATYHTSQPYFFVIRQLIWLVVGVAIFFIFYSLGSDFILRLAIPLSLVMLGLLYALPTFGIRVNGMCGWFSLPWEPLGNIFIQPSELAKPVFILFLVNILMHAKRYAVGSWGAYGIYLMAAMAWFVPLVLQPDFGTLLIYLTGFSGVYWFYGGRLRHLLASLLACIPLLLAAMVRYPYLKSRFIGFIDPIGQMRDAGWHILQLQATIAGGGIWGRSLGNTIWSRNYLPLGYSDSIFATLAESLGLMGVLPIIVGIIAWIVYCSDLAKKQEQHARGVIIAGIAIMLAVQAFIHISVALGLMPPTGITLPMFSYGGSSLVSTFASVGIIMNFARETHEMKPNPEIKLRGDHADLSVSLS